jgi:hypothetical protein
MGRIVPVDNPTSFCVHVDATKVVPKATTLDATTGKDRSGGEEKRVFATTSKACCDHSKGVIGRRIAVVMPILAFRPRIAPTKS